MCSRFTAANCIPNFPNQMIDHDSNASFHSKLETLISFMLRLDVLIRGYGIELGSIPNQS
jgi:hypothetical protein